MAVLTTTETKKPGLQDRAFRVSGAENRNRTYDLRVTSALLYRLSYFGVHVATLAVKISASKLLGLQRDNALEPETRLKISAKIMGVLLLPLVQMGEVAGDDVHQKSYRYR